MHSKVLHTLVGRHLVRVGAPRVADEDAHGPPRRHVAVDLVLRPFGGKLQEARLSKAEDLLCEYAPARSLSRCTAIVAALDGIHEQATMLEEPRTDRMGHGDLPPNPASQA